MRGMDVLVKYLKQKRGRQTELARAIGTTPGNICQWKRVPAERVMEVSAITGIPKEKLRPDLYGTQ